MDLIKRIDWESLVEYWEERKTMAACCDEYECRELWGEEEAASRISSWESEFEEMAIRIGYYEEGELEKSIEDLSLSYLSDFILFDEERYDWQEVEFALLGMCRKEPEQKMKEEWYAKAKLVSSDKYEEAFLVIGKDFLEDYAY